MLEKLVPEHRARKLARQWHEDRKGKSHATVLDHEPGIVQPGLLPLGTQLPRRKQAA